MILLKIEIDNYMLELKNRHKQSKSLTFAKKDSILQTKKGGNPVSYPGSTTDIEKAVMQLIDFYEFWPPNR